MPQLFGGSNIFGGLPFGLNNYEENDQSIKDFMPMYSPSAMETVRLLEEKEKNTLSKNLFSIN